MHEVEAVTVTGRAAASAARWTSGLWLAATSVLALAQAAVLEVLPLRYRQAAEVIPVVQPMLAPGGTVSGFQGQLVVRTTPANLEEIKRIIASLDAAPRQLTITVRQDTAIERSGSSAEVSGSVGGEHGRATVPGSRDAGAGGGTVVLRDGDDRLRARVAETGSLGNGRDAQTVRVMEGREAFISVGQSVPVRERQVQRTVVGGRVVEQTVTGGVQYRDVTSGFYVKPRLSGDRVTLDISTQSDSLSRQVSGGVNVQNVATTVSGRLGEWMEIGGIGQDSSSQSSVLLGRSTSATRDSRRVLIKVEEVR